MVGDDAESDVASALSAGIGLGILVRTGRFRVGDGARFHPPPSLVADVLSAAVEESLRHAREG